MPPYEGFKVESLKRFITMTIVPWHRTVELERLTAPEIRCIAKNVPNIRGNLVSKRVRNTPRVAAYTTTRALGVERRAATADVRKM